MASIIEVAVCDIGHTSLRCTRPRLPSYMEESLAFKAGMSVGLTGLKWKTELVHGDRLSCKIHTWQVLFCKFLNHYTEADLGKLDGVERGRRALDGAHGSELAGLIRTTSCPCLCPPPMDSPNTPCAWLFWVSLKGEPCYQLWPVLLRVLFDLWGNSSGWSPWASLGVVCGIVKGKQPSH